MYTLQTHLWLGTNEAGTNENEAAAGASHMRMTANAVWMAKLLTDRQQRKNGQANIVT